MRRNQWLSFPGLTSITGHYEVKWGQQRSDFENQNFWFKTHVSYAVLSPDSNGVICIGVQCSELPKTIVIEIFDVMTLHTQRSHLVVKNKWNDLKFAM